MSAVRFSATSGKEESNICQELASVRSSSPKASASKSRSIASSSRVLEENEDPEQGQENHGTAAALLHNAVKGVTEGWKKELEVAGTGYRCSIKNGVLTMFLGYSHDVQVKPIGKYTKITCPDETHILVEGVDRQEVGQTAATIYDCHRPDVYGNKGVHYKGQKLIKKVGKRAAAGGKK